MATQVQVSKDNDMWVVTTVVSGSPIKREVGDDHNYIMSHARAWARLYQAGSVIKS